MINVDLLGDAVFVELNNLLESNDLDNQIIESSKRLECCSDSIKLVEMQYNLLKLSRKLIKPYERKIIDVK